jgi:hypothetical protein
LNQTEEGIGIISVKGIIKLIWEVNYGDWWSLNFGMTCNEVKRFSIRQGRDHSQGRF